MKAVALNDVLIASEIKNVHGVVKNLMDYIKSLNIAIEESLFFEIKVILNELILNAIKHGNKEDSSKSVRISMGVTKNEYIYFIIEDEGTGYDYQGLLDKNSSPNQIIDICNLKECGRGILIVRDLCDNIKFNSKGNKVIILKKISN